MDKNSAKWLEIVHGLSSVGASPRLLGSQVAVAVGAMGHLVGSLPAGEARNQVVAGFKSVMDELDNWCGTRIPHWPFKFPHVVGPGGEDPGQPLPKLTNSDLIVIAANLNAIASTLKDAGLQQIVQNSAAKFTQTGLGE